MDVQQKRPPFVVDGPDPHRPRLRERVAIPLPSEPEREEHVIDGVPMRLVAVGYGEIESSLAGAARHGATADVLDCRIR